MKSSSLELTSNSVKTNSQVILESIADTFCPSLDAETAASIDARYCSLINVPHLSKQIRYSYYSFKPSDIPNCGLLMEDYLSKALPGKTLMHLLGTSAGTFLLTGYRSPFPSLSQKEREGALHALQDSWFQDLQILFRAFLSISFLHTYGLDAASEISWKALSYSPESAYQEQKKSADLWRPILLDPTNDLVDFVECDIVVVGSGCGGGLMAAELSKAGYHVVLCEKADFTHNSDYVYIEREAMLKMYERGGALQSENGSITVLAASAWGGGSAINWCASFKLPFSVREEWANKNGLKHLVSAEFDQAQDVVCNKLGVDDSAVQHNIQNQVLLSGCEKIGLKAETIKQNTSGRDHQCGWCTMGCPSGVKNASHLTWIKTAGENGCRFISGINIDKIIHSNRAAQGVEGHKNGKKVIIKAKKSVVISGGSVSTPALLLRSRIPDLNPHVGKHMRLHPVSVVSGVFPDRIIAPHQGSIMTSVSTYIDEKGYGYKIETPTSLPALFAASQKWYSGSQHKERMLKWKHTSSLLILTRDYDSEGSIYVDAAGKPRLEWSLGPKDEKSMLHGIESSVKILIAEGAQEIYTSQMNIESFFPDKSKTHDQIFNSLEFKNFIEKIHQEGLKPRKTLLFSAHQMGTCRMHIDPKHGAINPRGKLHGLNKVYIGDASVFPTASGVNPMITTYSMAYSIAQSLKEDLQKSSKL